MSAVRGSPVDMARFMVTLAPNRPDLRLQLDAALAKSAGALRRKSLPLELQRVPKQEPLL